jgi:cobalamin biosynthesis Co2+ chelatase CbiK
MDLEAINRVIQSINPQIGAAIIGGVIILLGWLVNGWLIGRKIENEKARNISTNTLISAFINQYNEEKLENIRVQNEAIIEGLKYELQIVSVNMIDRRKTLINLHESMYQARDAAWNLVHDAGNPPKSLLSKMTHSFQAISAFFVASNYPSNTFLLEDSERKQLNVVNDNLTELFLALDIDANNDADLENKEAYKSKLQNIAKRLDGEVEKFEVMIRSAFPIQKPASLMNHQNPSGSNGANIV